MHKDPVCGMDLKPEQAAGQSDYAGETYYFCSTACKHKFDENPQAYATQKGEPITKSSSSVPIL